MTFIDIIGKEKLKTLSLIFVVTFILTVTIDILINPTPPRIIFVDRESDIALPGKVYLNGEYVGEATEQGFEALPDSFCKGENDIGLEVADKTFSWPTSKNDCALNFLAFVIQKSVTERPDVTMKFFVRETKEPLAGQLHFDNELVATVAGDITLTIEECKNIQSIKLTAETFDAEWFHHTRWCDAYSVIEYSVLEKDLEESDLGSVIDIIAGGGAAE